MKLYQLRQLVNLLDQRNLPPDIDVRVLVVENELPGIVSFSVTRDPGTSQPTSIQAVVSAS